MPCQNQRGNGDIISVSCFKAKADEGVATISFKNSVVDRIDNVRDWLDRAEQNYKEGENGQGEMNLNLAQAELKKAWEDSRKLNRDKKVVYLAEEKERDDKRKQIKEGIFKNFIPARTGIIAMILVLILVGTPLFLRKGSSPGNLSRLSNERESQIQVNYTSLYQDVPLNFDINGLELKADSSDDLTSDGDLKQLNSSEVVPTFTPDTEIEYAPDETLDFIKEASYLSH